MKVLSIETTSEVCSVALLEDDKICSEHRFQTSDAARRLISSIDILLKENNVKPSELELLVVSYGPGQWTGVRLGMGAAKGIAAGTEAKIFCVGAMDSIFFGIREFKMPAFCIINAYREEVYLSSFNGRFAYKRNYPIKRIKFEELDRLCGEKDVLLTGSGIFSIPDKIKKCKSVNVVERYSSPSAGINGLLAIEKIRRGVPSAPLKPFYGR